MHKGIFRISLSGNAFFIFLVLILQYIVKTFLVEINRILVCNFVKNDENIFLKIFQIKC